MAENKAWQVLKDYAKCAMKNRFTLASYTGLGISALGLGISALIKHYAGNQIGSVSEGLAFTENSLRDLQLMSISVLISTSLGFETYLAYRRTRKHIRKYRIVNQKFKEKFSKWYCTQIGVKLAIDEDERNKTRRMTPLERGITDFNYSE